MALGLRSTLFLVALGLIGPAVVGSELWLVPRLRREREALARAELHRLAAVAAAAARVTAPGELPALARRLSEAGGTRIDFIARDGRRLGGGDAGLGPEERLAGEPEVRAALAGAIGHDRRRKGRGAPDLYLALPPRADDPVVVRASLSLAPAEAAADGLGRSLLYAGALAAVAAAAMSAIAAHLVARPLREMTSVARDLAARRFGRRVREPAEDEVGALGAALNALSADLERTLADLVGERDLLGTVLNGMADGVLVSDGDGRIVRANSALSGRLGVSPGAIAPGRTVLEATRSAALAAHLAEVRRARAPLTGEVEIPGPPAQVLRLSSAPLASGGGTVSVVHDITEMRRVERMRRDFVANVSHELRTPVAALQAAGETLLAGALDDPPRAREFTAVVARNAERLGLLVTDLLALTRIESGALDLALEPVAVGPAAERVLAALVTRIRGKRLQVEQRIAPGTQVLADRRALEQILHNLFENAVNYTPENGAVLVDAVAQGASLVIRVSDTGPGIPADARERVFERFYRVDPGRSRALGGTGLGLSIVKHLVEAMGGKTGVEDRDGGGSRFWFALPRGGG